MVDTRIAVEISPSTTASTTGFRHPGCSMCGSSRRTVARSGCGSRASLSSTTSFTCSTLRSPAVGSRYPRRTDRGALRPGGAGQFRHLFASQDRRSADRRGQYCRERGSARRHRRGRHRRGPSVGAIFRRRRKQVRTSRSIPTNRRNPIGAPAARRVTHSKPLLPRSGGRPALIPPREASWGERGIRLQDMGRVDCNAARETPLRPLGESRGSIRPGHPA